MVDDGVAIASLLVSFDRLDCLDVGSGKVSIWACMRLWVWSLQPMDSMVTLVACEGGGRCLGWTYSEFATLGLW